MKALTTYCPSSHLSRLCFGRGRSHKRFRWRKRLPACETGDRRILRPRSSHFSRFSRSFGINASTASKRPVGRGTQSFSVRQPQFCVVFVSLSVNTFRRQARRLMVPNRQPHQTRAIRSALTSPASVLITVVVTLLLMG